MVAASLRTTTSAGQLRLVADQLPAPREHGPGVERRHAQVGVAARRERQRMIERLGGEEVGREQLGHGGAPW
jgi:hypothetical protein